MTGKVLDNGSAGILVLILPFAFGFVILYHAMAIFATVSNLDRSLSNYGKTIQWTKWCEDSKSLLSIS